MTESSAVDLEFFEVFVAECGDLLDNLEPVVVGFGRFTGTEGSALPMPEELAKGIQETFRLFHTIKGNAAYLELMHISGTAHAAEDLLAQVRSGQRRLQADDVDLLCQTCDFMRSALDHIATEYNDQTMAAGAQTLAEQLRSAAATPAAPTPATPIASTNTTAAARAETPAKRQDLRVDLGKVDTLSNLIGELVIAKNMLIQSPDLEGLELENFGRAAQTMGKIVRELQDVAMAIRMVPVVGLFNRMQRLVRDLCRQFDKQVEFITVGAETEMDKTVVEKVTDPLVHLIRNALDHGLEAPAERLAHGKPAQGTLRLSATHEEGEIVVRLEDDGRGLDREKILAKARERGLLGDDGTELTDREVNEMIFLPGFSTAEKVTGVSGRGVGMDVVRQNLASIRGRIEIDSSPGQGTRMTLRIPLTMAIIDGMMLRVGRHRFIIPVYSIRESFQPDPDSITVTPDGEETVKLRNRLFPILRLHQVNQLTPESTELADGILILLESRGRLGCLFVDEILGQQQTVIKGLSEYLGRVGETRCVSGCTILSNGEISLILDADGLLSLV